MLCSSCKTLWPYAPGNPTCMTCGGRLRLSADDLLGDTPVRIVSEVRRPQVEFAKVIERGLLLQKDITAEAGTGTGKSFAVLLPAILKGSRTIISTATTVLQNQYIKKDLPFLADALLPHGINLTYALAKGKSHYMCLGAYQAMRKKKDPRLTPAFISWAEQTHHGDKQELGDDIPKFWSEISAEECVGLKRCPHAQKCGYAIAKGECSTAQIVVANHSICGFNIRLGSILIPNYELMIFDEGHKALEYLRKAFSSTLSERRIPRLTEKVEESGVLDKENIQAIGLQRHAGALAGVHAHMDRLCELNKEMFDKFYAPLRGKAQAFGTAVIEKNATEMIDVIREICGPLGEVAITDTGDSELDTSLGSLGLPKRQDGHPAAAVFVNKFRRVAEVLQALANVNEDEKCVRYVSFPANSKQSRELVYAPLDIAPLLRAALFSSHRVISTSATITVNNSFDYFQRDLGFDPKETLTYIAASPFDYANRARLYLTNVAPVHPSRAKIPEGTPQYDAALTTYYDKMAEEIYDLINVTNGHAFVLFTSRVEMLEIGKRVQADASGYGIMLQEEDTTPAALEAWFRREKNPVLFGLKSFWEGVSIEGDQLRNVIICKVPFPQREDLVYQAMRNELVTSFGGGPSGSIRAFRELDVPLMILDVKQAVGRLLRTMSDYGVISILDRKISDEWNKRGSYAHALIQSLPFEARMITKSKQDLVKFLRNFMKV